MSFNEDFLPFTPTSFFQFSCACQWINLKEWQKSLLKDKKYLLPSTGAFCDEEIWAKIAMGWNAAGLLFGVQISEAFQHSYYPDVSRGDSVELFIDVRDVKTSGYNTRFCHHFYFLPVEVDGFQQGEMTRFRTEDRHDLCKADDLKLEVDHGYGSCTLKIFIPSHVLNGYDPEQFDRLGFTYRINRVGGPAQHFSVVSNEFALEQLPSLWSSVKLVKE